MTAHDPRVTLTEAEREELRPFDAGFYSCDCEDERCATPFCDNNRDDLQAAVERIIAARLAPIRALAEVWTYGYSPGAPSQRYADALRAALDAPVSGSQDHDGAEGRWRGGPGGRGARRRLRDLPRLGLVSRLRGRTRGPALGQRVEEGAP